MTQEIDSLVLAMRNNNVRIRVEDPVLQRVRDLVYSWLTAVRSNLEAIGVPIEVLNRVNTICFKLTRLTSDNSRRQRYQAILRSLGRILVEQVLHEVTLIPIGVRASVAPTRAERLLADIPDLPNQLIPNALHGWIPKIKAFLRQNDFGRNVFIMVSYRPELTPLVRRVKKTLIKLRLNPIVARDHPITDDLNNPIACLLCCSYGVAIFDRPHVNQQHNPNVVYELGMMTLLKRPCIILKHRRLRRMPSDILSRLYEDYDSIDDAVNQVNDWWARSRAQ
jgi:hypothetical protein